MADATSKVVMKRKAEHHNPRSTEHPVNMAHSPGANMTNKKLKSGKANVLLDSEIEPSNDGCDHVEVSDGELPKLSNELDHEIRISGSSDNAMPNLVDSEDDGSIDNICNESDDDEDDLFGEYMDEDEDEGAGHLEVEEQEHIVPGEPTAAVKLKLSVSKEEEFEEWLDDIHVSCSYDGKDIGHVLARFIRRESIRANFWRDMEEPCRDMSNLAFEVFDRYGFVQTKLKDHIIQRGTGVWGEELDYGSLLLVEHLEIKDTEWRRKGLGRVMIQSLIEKVQRRETPKEPKTAEDIAFQKIWFGDEDLEKYSKLHVVVLPGWLRTDVEPKWKGKPKHVQRKINSHAAESAEAFFLALGFRRVGGSECFALSLDPEHKSRQVAATDDYTPPSECFEEEEADDDEDTEDNWLSGRHREAEKKLAALKQRLPLHHATTTMGDLELVEHYKKVAADNVIDWTTVDRSHNTLLHVAACKLKPNGVKWLLEHVNEGGCLSTARNIKGYTAIEALQSELEIERTRLQCGLMTVVTSDQFQGYHPSAVTILAFLSSSPPRFELPKDQVLRLTFGCTCGECVEGFLSPRMKMALLYQAETTHDMMHDIDIYDGPEWCRWHHHLIMDLTPAMQQNFRTNKSLRQGFANIFDHIATCLKSSTIPTRDNVLATWEECSEWPPVTRSFLERFGTTEGKVEAALKAIFDNAKEQDEKIGDEEFKRTMTGELGKLKVCRNDHEYGFVAHACGLIGWANPYGE